MLVNGVAHGIGREIVLVQPKPRVLGVGDDEPRIGSVSVTPRKESLEDLFVREVDTADVGGGAERIKLKAKAKS